MIRMLIVGYVFAIRSDHITLRQSIRVVQDTIHASRLDTEITRARAERTSGHVLLHVLECFETTDWRAERMGAAAANSAARDRAPQARSDEA
jgi:hypothetical protein